MGRGPVSVTFCLARSSCAGGACASDCGSFHGSLRLWRLSGPSLRGFHEKPNGPARPLVGFSRCTMEHLCVHRGDNVYERGTLAVWLTLDSSEC